MSHTYKEYCWNLQFLEDWRRYRGVACKSVIKRENDRLLAIIAYRLKSLLEVVGMKDMEPLFQVTHLANKGLPIDCRKSDIGRRALMNAMVH